MIGYFNESESADQKKVVCEERIYKGKTIEAQKTEWLTED